VNIIQNVTLEDAGKAAAPPPGKAAAAGNKTANATADAEGPKSEMQMYCTCNDEVRVVLCISVLIIIWNYIFAIYS
jgi:hypothetical protein